MYQQSKHGASYIYEESRKIAANPTVQKGVTKSKDLFSKMKAKASAGWSNTFGSGQQPEEEELEELKDKRV